MSRFKVGIVGGGQLAGMLAETLARHDVDCLSLDPDVDSPAVGMGALGVIGDRKSATDIAKLAELADVVTVDLEDVNVDALAVAEASGRRVIPPSGCLQLLTDKLLQKETLVKAGLPTATFVRCDGSAEFDYGQLGWPVVQKAARGGYDGRGVVILDKDNAHDDRLPVGGYIEAYVPDAIELAAMVAREPSGRTTVWNTVEMEFDPDNNLLTYLIAPARCDEAVNKAAQSLAKDAVNAFEGVGLFGVEFFLTPDGDLLINEIAPRTHNSGHFTMDACRTSQFEAQYQILTDQPVGDPAQERAAVMFNVLGKAGFEGDTVVEGLDILSDTDNVFPHLYGKKRCFPFRKMGHVTVVGNTVAEAQALAEKMHSVIIVRGQDEIEQETA